MSQSELDRATIRLILLLLLLLVALGVTAINVSAAREYVPPGCGLEQAFQLSVEYPVVRYETYPSRFVCAVSILDDGDAKFLTQDGYAFSYSVVGIGTSRVNVDLVGANVANTVFVMTAPRAYSWLPFVSR